MIKRIRGGGEVWKFGGWDPYNVEVSLTTQDSGLDAIDRHYDVRSSIEHSQIPVVFSGKN